MSDEKRDAMREQFSVVWKREGIREKRRIFARKASAERWLALIGPEPWLAFPKQSPDDQCCDGWDCGCEGKTLRQRLLDDRAKYPPVEYLRVESRPIGEWTPVASPAISAVASPSLETL